MLHGLGTPANPSYKCLINTSISRLEIYDQIKVSGFVSKVLGRSSFYAFALPMRLRYVNKSKQLCGSFYSVAFALPMRLRYVNKSMLCGSFYAVVFVLPMAHLK